MRIFKYTGHVTEILERMQVKVSRAEELNDPFEVAPRIDPSQFTRANLRKFMRRREQLERAYKLEREKLGVSKREYKRHYRLSLKARLDLSASVLPGAIESARLNFTSRFSSGFRLFCASKTVHSILMWSHYSKNHEGGVVEFETAQPAFPDLEKLLGTVSYAKEKPSFTARLNNVSGAVEELMAVVRTKSEEWSYEQEVRAAIPVEACVGGQFFPFSPLAIRRVYLGARMPDAMRKTIIGHLATEELAHTGIVQAQLSPDHYRLDFEELRSERAG